MTAEFWCGVACGAGGLMVLSVLVLAFLAYTAPVAEDDDLTLGL